MNDNNSGYFYHPLENIEDVEIFETAIDRRVFSRKLSPERPYTYWTLELYDQDNGIRGGGGLGILAADTRRVAEQVGVPLTLVTPFYPSETHQKWEDGRVIDLHKPVNYADFGFSKIDDVFVKCCGNLCRLEVIEKKFGSTRILAVTEPNFGELYSGLSGSDHRLYQEVSLGFGGYQALKLLGLKPAIMQLNEVATFFAALVRLDELASNGMDFYEAVVYTRKHTLYTNHTLVQAAEAEFSLEQFERFVFPNLKSKPVRKWLRDKFEDGRIKLSSVTIEIAELRSGVSKLHARVANYRDIAGERVKFKAITNGIDMEKWVMPEIMELYHKDEILDEYDMPTINFSEKLTALSSDEILSLKEAGRTKLNSVLTKRPDQNGEILHLKPGDLVFDFKRRFVDYKRPNLPFRDPARLRAVLEPYNAHYILAGRVHTGDERMAAILSEVLSIVNSDDYLRTHVHYIADYDEELAYALSVGSNVAINVPIVGLEACGTSWEKDVANLNLLISTHDGGVADGSSSSYLNVYGASEDEEASELYRRMEEAASAWQNGFDLEVLMRTQLAEFLPVISGTRMLSDYLNYLLPE
ncbi:glycogen/starch/alpha-glucan phosphorylase [Candidatus Saccharibacteria bacterium]|nr:glycogen/starch/alpha-glucan phosphorylase [Candidatus Saccharibacteria bacterium]MBR0424210.1 glycogen/starch/alpha-glucan phosphorylase [Candidatus Saccharibacteria bacterium]